MLIIYIITIIILTVLVFYLDYQINQNTIVSAFIKSFLFILCSIGISYLILYLRGDLSSIPDNNNNNNNNKNNSSSDKKDNKNANKKILNAIQNTTNKIPGEINKNLQLDENFFSNFLTN